MAEQLDPRSSPRVTRVVWRARRRDLREAQWWAPLVGAVLGLVLALLVDAVQPDVEEGSFGVTVDRARDSLWSALALVFTGLSIVLALASLTAQNLASRFSPRLLRVKLRLRSEKLPLFVFTTTATYVLTELLLNRTAPPDSLATPLSLMVGVVLLVLSAVVIVWYTNRTLREIRVDYTTRRVANLIRRTSRAIERAHRHDVAVAPDRLAPPAGAIELTADDSGYLVRLDVDLLHRLAVANGVIIAVQVRTGALVVPGQDVGWIDGEAADLALAGRAMTALELAEARDPSRDLGYDIGLLADIALTALSPAVNDPHTAVQTIDQLTLVLDELARHRLGPRGRVDDVGDPIVLVDHPTLGELVHDAGRQILHYGADDRTVVAALTRLAAHLERVGPLEHDRRLAGALTGEISEVAVRATPPGLVADPAPPNPARQTADPRKVEHQPGHADRRPGEIEEPTP